MKTQRTIHNTPFMNGTTPFQGTCYALVQLG